MKTLRSYILCVCVCLLNCFRHVLLFVTPMGHSLPGSCDNGILQASILEWVAMPSSRGFSPPRIKPSSFTSPALAGRFFTISTTWEALEGAE